NVLGHNRIISILSATLGGIPLYVCGGAVIPVLQVLRDSGMDKGAILAFFISGPGTKFSTLVALTQTLTKEAFMLYLTIVFSGAVLFGFVYSAWR
ncbi:MAG: permease, partial [Candidatus Gracilibacteria bacterium]|nr:permease [Candidatus Gracilibacteria bacterium]